MSDIGYDSESLDVGNDMGSRIEQVKVDDPIDLGDGNIPCTLKRTVSSARRQRRQMAAARRKASVCHVVILANSYIP